MAMVRKEVPAGVFKQGCLALIDDVAASKREIVITTRGKPEARVVPMEDPREREKELLAQWRGKARQLVQDDELMSATSELVDWKALEE
jgi:prevent-host-death family protein